MNQSQRALIVPSRPHFVNKSCRTISTKQLALQENRPIFVGENRTRPIWPILLADCVGRQKSADFSWQTTDFVGRRKSVVCTRLIHANIIRPNLRQGGYICFTQRLLAEIFISWTFGWHAGQLHLTTVEISLTRWMLNLWMDFSRNVACK